MRKIATMFLALLCFMTVKAQTTLVNEGFEVIPHTFTSSETAGVPHWDTTTAYKFAGLASIRGKVTTANFTTLSSAKFVTTGYTRVYLRFKHICRLPNSDKGSLFYRVGGGNWTAINSTPATYLTPIPTGETGYTTAGGFKASSYTDWTLTAADSAALPSNTWWKSELFDLSSLISNQDTAQIQFRIAHSTGTTGLAYYGWLLDNIEIIGSNNEIAPPAIVQQPVIFHDTIVGTGPWTINALITDESTIASANLVYSTLRLGVPAGPFTVPMTLGTGNVYSADVPSMSYLTKVTYYINASDQYGNTDSTATKWFYNKRPPALLTVASDTISSGNMPNPYYQYYTQAKVQFIVKASELAALGLPAGNLNSIAFYVNAVSPATSNGSLFKNFSIKIANTPLSATTSAFATPSFTTVYSAPDLVGNHTTGWNTFNFSNAFVWDGTSNIIVETCFNNYNGSTGDYSSNATIRQSVMTYPASTSAYTDTDVPDICSDAGSLSISASNNRPAVQFGYIQVDVALDAGISAIVEPAGTLIASSISDVKVRIKSGGTTDLTSATVNWILDGVPQTSFPWTGLLTQDQVSANLTLATGINFTPGIHVIKVWTSAPNGGTDLYAGNDTMQVSIYSCGGTLAAGTYTVGGASPDFATFADVKTKLNTCGITGPVVFNVRPGTYNTSLNLTQILGGSFTNTVTIKSENNDPTSVVILDTVNSSATLLLDTVSNFRLQSVTLKTTAKNRNRLVWLRGRSVDVQFTNNIFEGLDTNILSNNYALIYSNKGISDKDSVLVVDGNTFKNGSYGIYLYGNSSNISNSITIQNNIFQSQAYNGIYLYYNNNYTVNNNTITQSATSTQSFYGLYLSYCKEGKSVSKNKILAKNLNYGLYIYYSKGSSSNPMLVSNNFIASSGTVSAGYGFYVYYADSTNYVYNTVNLNGNASTSRAFYVSSGSSLDVRNNNFANNAGGYAYYVATLPTNWLSNYNNLYSTGAAIGYYSTAKINIAAWRTAISKDTNSVSVNPSFSSYNNFHIYELGLDGKAQPYTLVNADIEDQVRNATTPDIGCDEFEVAAINLGFTAIVQPAITSSCGGSGMPITVSIKSAGSGTIDFVTNNTVLTAQVTGPIPQTYTLTLDTGSLVSGASRNVVITNALDFSIPGVYNLKIFSTLPADTIRLNDTITGSYNFSKITTFPYDVNFSAAPSPAWTIAQLSGSVAWQYATGSMANPTLAPVYGTGRLYFNSYTGSGSKSRATTPVLDFTGMTHPYLEFWMSQDVGYSSDLQEGVTVKISSDGGATWNNDTLFVQRYNSAYTTADWKLFSKHLTTYANLPCVKIAFDAYSQGGNNLSIDRVVVRNLSNNDLKMNVVYTKGKLPITYGTPDSVKVIVENIGALTQYNKVVSVDVTGANTQTLTYTIDSIPSFTTKTIALPGLNPTVVGLNTVTASVPNDDDNSNNAKAYRLETTNDMFGYADTSAVAIKAIQANGLMLSKFKLNGTRSIRSVRAYITGGTTLNKVVYGVVLNNAGQVIDRSVNDTIVAADTAQWRTFTFPNWYNAILTDSTFYVGIAQIGTGYNPLGAQTEVPVRTNKFFTAAALTGGALTSTTTQGRFMIEAEIGPLPPYDAVLQAITNPISGCGIGSQAVTLNIKNNGTNNIAANDVTAWYTVNGGAAVSLPVNVPISSGSAVNFSFVPEDFSAPTVNVTYTINAWVNLSSDPINTNDSISNYVVVSKPIPSVPTILSANPTSVEYNTPVTINAENPTGIDGDINWYTTNVSNSSLATNPNYTSGLLTSDTNFFASFTSLDGRGTNILGTGSVSTSYIPFYYLYDFGWSSSIYKRSEIQYRGTIDTLWVEINSASTTGIINTQKVYLSTIADSTFADANYDDPTGMTLVYNGDITIPASGWLAIPLTTPYNYTGNGNLLLHWENWDGSWSGNPNPTFKSTTMANVAKYQYQDASMPTTVGTMSSSRTNIKFNGATYGCASPRVDVVVNVNNIPTVEVQPMAVTAPTTGCALHQEYISVTVKNNLQTVAPIGTFVYYQINGGTPVVDTMDVAINVGQTIPFTFSQAYDFSAPTATTPYTIKVWTAATGDTYTVNDTINYNFQSKWTATDLTLTDVTIPYGTSHTFTYPDWLRVYSNATATNQIFFGQNYQTPILYDTVTYWMESVLANGTPMSQLIGTGTATQTYVPFYYNYDYGWSAALYKRSEFNSVGSIDTVWFQVSSASTTGMFANQKMYLSIVPDTVFAGLTQPDRNAMTLVFDGGLNIPASGWIGVPLSAPFTYDGSGSLMLYWENREGSYSGNPSPNWASTTIANVAKYKYQDGSFPEGLSGSTSSSRPNARFSGMDISCPSPLKQITVSVSGIPTQDAGVIKYNGPLGGSYLSTTEHISVVVKNFGSAPISNFPVSYKVENGTPVTETFTGTLNTLDTITFVFATNQDLSSLPTTTHVKAYTSLTGDNYPTNDTIMGSIAVPVYCTSNATSPTTDMDLGNVTFAGINNGFAWPLLNNTTAINGYTDFTQTVAPAYIAKGGIYPFSATQINKSAYVYQGVVNVYIDLNRNGIFDATELVYSGLSTSTTTTPITYAQSTSSGVISIPLTAQSGPTRMRVVLDESDVAPACGTYTWGETEDYTVVLYSATDPDAALTNFVNPTIPSAVEGNLVPIKVNLTNVGTNPITAASIKLLHNGTLVSTQAWTGSLASLASVVDSITTVSLLVGDNNFTAFVTLTGDNMHFNDTIRFLLNALPRYDVKPIAVLNPTSLSCPNINENVVVRITNIGQDTLFLAANNVVVKTQILINNATEYQTTVSTGILPVNGTLDVNVTNVANFSTGGAYRIRAMVFLAGDGNLANDTLLTDTFTIITPVVALPAIENFETFTVGVGPFPNDWTSTTTTTTTNKYLWRANAGPTLSGTASGPAVDHTVGTAAGKYAYVYGGYGAANDVSNLISRCYNFSGVTGQQNGVTFWYHMFNPGTNAKLFVEYGSGSNWTTVDSIVNQQQTSQTAPWLQKVLVLPNDNRNGRVRFRAVKGSTAGDIAIDDINFTKLLPDVGVTSIITPGAYSNGDSVMVNSHVTVKATIHNFGLLTLDTIPVAYKVGTDAEVNETFIGSIPAGGDADYTFTTTYIVPAPRMHYLCVYTKLLYDLDATNDKSCRNVTSYADTTHPGFNEYNVAEFNLAQNIPNPASDMALINFNMPQSGKVLFKVTDLLGKELYTEDISAEFGANSIKLNTVNFAPGIYYYWVEYKDRRLVKKMNIVK